MGETIREAIPEERSRAGYLFRHDPVPIQSLVLMAVRMAPVDRFVGALAMWNGEPGSARFPLAPQPGVDAKDFATLSSGRRQSVRDGAERRF